MESTAGRSTSLSPRAIGLLVAALFVPVVTLLVFSDWTAEQGVLIWLAALIPAFLLVFYKGWTWFAALLQRERHLGQMSALSDPLTGLPSGSYSELFLQAAFAAAERGRSLAVVLFDVDGFGRVTDEHGGQAGDEVLRALADVLRHTSRRSDLAARMVGERFMAILTDGDARGAVIYANKVREAVAALELPCGPITVSAGVAVPMEGMRSLDLLVAEADRALHYAKELGSDRVELASDVPRVEPGEPLQDPAVTRDRARILVVDDDAAVLRAVERVFADEKRSVLSARSGQAALALAEAHGPIDLVITDIMMPGMSGFTMVDRLIEAGHPVSVVFMSGYLQKGATWEAAPGRQVSFVEKPLDPVRLMAEVGTLLTQRTGGGPGGGPVAPAGEHEEVLPEAAP